MTEKEISEIRRRFNIDKTNISCIRGCYVNENKEIISFNVNQLRGISVGYASFYSKSSQIEESAPPHF